VILGKGREGDEAVRYAVDANKEVGAEVAVYDYPDNAFDTVPLKNIVLDVEDEIDVFRPTAVFTHFTGDLNIDHQITHRAVMTAARPLPGSTIKIIASFEVASSTGWYNEEFQPDFYVTLFQNEVDAKMWALEKYESEMRPAPHARSMEAVRSQLSYRGYWVGAKYAEAFKILRVVL
jgi:LmbE family N-acetylglucosaminyl deacetylase